MPPLQFVKAVAHQVHQLPGVLVRNVEAAARPPRWASFFVWPLCPSVTFAETRPVLTPLPAAKRFAEAVQGHFELLPFAVARDVPACLTHTVALLHGVAILRNSENAVELHHREASKRPAGYSTATGGPWGLARNLGGRPRAWMATAKKTNVSV